MKALLLHDIVNDAAIAHELAQAAYEVLRCAPSSARPFPCVVMSGPCPLDGTVDAAVVVHDRPTTEVATGEIGSICARRDGVPIVLAGNGTHSPLQEIASAVAPSAHDVVGA